MVFLVSNGENVILPLLAPPAKSFLTHPWKIHYRPFLAKIFLAHPWKIHYWPLPGKNPSGAHV